MTESSIFWENNSTGDGTSGGYSQTKFIEWVRVIFTKTANRGGVSPDYLNKLAVSGTSSPVAVNTGAAVCYGFFYSNDASLNVTVPTPSTNTRIDRIVLRVDWSAQTVRVTRIAGTEGGGAPTLTQTPNTTWDVPLAQVSITTGGVITLTDQREWLDVTGDGMVTAAKLASDSVDDSKLGERVPQFYSRQGGHPTAWGNAGSTNYDPGMVRMCGGRNTVSLSSGSGTGVIVYPTGFSQTPFVYISPSSTDTSVMFSAKASDLNLNTFTCHIEQTKGTPFTGSVSYVWLAIGPE